jgi:hypothetical protein
MDDWPKGLHAAEATLKYNERRWVETKKAMINQAYQQAAHSSADADAQYRKEKRLRLDAFFWKQATTANTLESYEDYLQEFPGGRFVLQARIQINAITHRANAGPPRNAPAPQ